MAHNSSSDRNLVTFLRSRDYEMLNELGQGACGKTVLLRDDVIDELYVCKKYAPYSESRRPELFRNFCGEIKILHKLHHENVVRIYNHFLYPDFFTGYIMMEYVQGSEIDQYAAKAPDKIGDLFLQAVEGFTYLEKCGVLHRDIRNANLMVRDDGRLKIIDLGFGKQVETKSDFDKSISLAWWCTLPSEFSASVYDFRTEVYFVGKLFERLLLDNAITDFKYADVLRRMCNVDPAARQAGFTEISRDLLNRRYSFLEFNEFEQQAYRNFSSEVWAAVSKIDRTAKYVTDLDRLKATLSDVLRRCMLEDFVPDSSSVLQCLIIGPYYFVRNNPISVESLRRFVELLHSAHDEKLNIILANLQTRLDTISRYTEQPPQFSDDDIPF